MSDNKVKLGDSLTDGVKKQVNQETLRAVSYTHLGIYSAHFCTLCLCNRNCRDKEHSRKKDITNN